MTCYDDLFVTERYAREVVDGLRLVCKRERQACQRHLDDLERQGTDSFPYVFDESRANRIFDWFEKYCVHVRGVYSGQHIQLLPFQYFDLGCVFGWVHRETGARRFTKAFNFRARGNVKSTEMSGVALYGMCADAIYPPGKPELRRFEMAPEVECAAVDREQARRVWGDACSMGEASVEISQKLIIKRTRVEHKTRKGWMRALSKQTKNKDSGAPCMVIIDEYHAHPSYEIVDVLKSGFGKRLQSLLFIISTAGKDAENNPCKAEYDLCCKILDGDTDEPIDDYFCMIRELEDGDDPYDVNALVKANPVLQHETEYSKHLLKEIVSEGREAFVSNDPKKLREYLTKRCNLWQDSSELKYMDGLMPKWKTLKVTRDELYKIISGKRCIVGYDLSKRIDLTAATFIIPLDEKRVAVVSHGFIPEEAVKRHEQTDRIAYREYAQRGYCTITEGAAVDYDVMKVWVKCFANELDLDVVEHCFDGWNASYFMQKLEEEGETVIEVRQGIPTLSEPTKEFRLKVVESNIIHEGNELFDWCLRNAYAYTDSNENIKLSKKNKDDTQRIDLVAAGINAMARLPAFYEEYGGTGGSSGVRFL